MGPIPRCRSFKLQGAPADAPPTPEPGSGVFDTYVTSNTVSGSHRLKFGLSLMLVELSAPTRRILDAIRLAFLLEARQGVVAGNGPRSGSFNPVLLQSRRP